MKCPTCKSEGTLNWQLCACEFKCSNCGELFTITDLSKEGILKENEPASTDQLPPSESKTARTRVCNNGGKPKEGAKKDWHLKCVECGEEHPSKDYLLDCPNAHAPSFLRTVYENNIQKNNRKPGIFKYSDWLPTNKTIKKGGQAPITYKSQELAQKLGLKNLYISYNGYWPEKNAWMKTCSFKELEAAPTIGRLLEAGKNKAVVASAGNTARGFANACLGEKVELFLVVPKTGLHHLWLPEEQADNIHLISLERGYDYFDAISFAKKITENNHIISEGGARNVARRDGMGTTVVDATLEIGEVPDHYFQSVGSGTGGIAAWEANLRFNRHTNETKKMKLNLSQNSPFTPLVDSWRRGSRELVSYEESEAKKRIKEMYVRVLSNRVPAYSVRGGVYDALKDTNGEMYSVTNREAKKGEKLFRELEGIDILPAAGIGVGSLIKAVNEGKVERDDKILLNITGGGVERLMEDHDLHHIKPDLTVSPDESPESPLPDLEMMK